ncbi:MAG: hypothetical protein ACYCZD_15220 [Rhodanobacter sp.]
MKTELIQTQTHTFKAHAQADANHLPDVGKMVALRFECFSASLTGSNHFVDVNKMVKRAARLANITIFRTLGRLQIGPGQCCLTRRQPFNRSAIDPSTPAGYRNSHIRPMAVRPLDHPEREPTPWGFLFSGLGKTWTAPSQWRSQ